MCVMLLLCEEEDMCRWKTGNVASMKINSILIVQFFSVQSNFLSINTINPIGQKSKQQIEDPGFES